MIHTFFTRRAALVFLLLLQLVVPMVVRAQYNFDVLSIEAMIDDHKRTRTYLMSRSSQELVSTAQQSLVKDTVRGYGETNGKLDKFHNAFSILGLVVNGLSTFTRCYQSSKLILERVTDVINLRSKLEDIVEEDGVQSSDTHILEVFVRSAEKIRNDCNDIYSSVNWLVAGTSVGGATGIGPHFGTRELLDGMDAIGESFDRLRKDVDELYFQLNNYLLARQSPFFNKRIYSIHPRWWVIGEAKSRWRQSYAKSNAKFH